MGQLDQLFCMNIPSLGALPIVRAKAFVVALCNGIARFVGCERIKIYHTIIYSTTIHINCLSFLAYTSLVHLSLTSKYRKKESVERENHKVSIKRPCFLYAKSRPYT